MIERNTTTTHSTSVAPSARSAGHILVVDDEKPIVEMLRLLLEDEGFTVSGETSPAAALRTVRHAQPDLIITDVMMPGMTGYELARAAATIAPEVRVVFMSAVVDSGQSGRHPFLEKPFDLGTVIDTVEAELKVS
jgi:CheY-like chemotaxis protein